MDIIIITPARSSSRSGNDTTSRRWARILRGLGHSVRIAQRYDETPADLMVALHAWRSAESIRRFRELHPDRPLIVALSGTDINDYIERDPAPVLHSLACADRLIAFQGLARRRVPEEFRSKIRVVFQSAPRLQRLRPHADALEVAQIGHLRAVKDPFRPAWAARRLPPSSRILIVHLGGAETPEWAAQARTEMRANARYRWRGDRPEAEVRALLARARALVLPSLSEGGANAISEAAAAGVPVLASRIEGSVGLLGRDYPGYFPAGCTGALAGLLLRIETEPKFLKRLERAIERRAYLFRPIRERAAWRSLLQEVTAAKAGTAPDAVEKSAAGHPGTALAPYPRS